ncbi:MAG: type II/IV secretion system protein [Acidobacteriota bacterium]|nr:type II/IV secretion system protein [Acidobacteriota bacterium]
MVGFKKKNRDESTAKEDVKKRSSETVVHALTPSIFGESSSNAATKDASGLEDALRDVFAGTSVGLLGEKLIEKELVTREQLSAAFEVQHRSGGLLCDILCSMNVLDEATLAHAYAESFGFAMAELRRENISDDVLAYLDETVARESVAIPVRVDGSELLVAVAEPSDELRDVLARATKMPVRFLLAPLSDVRWAVDTNYRSIAHVEKLVQAFQSVEVTRKKAVDTSAADQSGDDAPVVQVVDSILTQAMRDRASDVHIEPSDDVIRVRFRIDGALKEIIQLPASIGPGLVSRIKVMANMNIVERRRPQDGQLAMTIDGHEVDVRVSTVATIMGESCVLRILDKTRSVLHLKDLGMPADTYETYSKMVRAPFGMVLCAGPTGSGKTTTLYATLSEVANHTVNVMTIEDPVEYVFPSINQIQTNEQAGLTFATGLKSILRQDPDAILVGEIRDVETTRVAVQSALTGHFVVSSLHATDSVSALHRFLDMGIESFLVASSVLGVVGQRLLRRICPSCKTTYTPTDEEMAFYEETGAPAKDVFYHGAGCNFCSGTGYKERIGVYELLVMTPEIKRLVVGWATQEEIRALAVKQGMRTMRQEAINLVHDDVTTIAEVIRSVYTL